jgi:hypothetical protein
MSFQLVPPHFIAPSGKSWREILHNTCQRYGLKVKRQSTFLSGVHFTTYIYWNGQAWETLGTADENTSRDEAARIAVTALENMGFIYPW